MSRGARRGGGATRSDAVRSARTAAAARRQRSPPTPRRPRRTRPRPRPRQRRPQTSRPKLPYRCPTAAAATAASPARTAPAHITHTLILLKTPTATTEYQRDTVDQQSGR